MASPPLSFPVTGHSAKILCSAAAAEMGAILWERVCCSGCSSQLAKHARETGSSGNTKGLCYRNLHGDLSSISLLGGQNACTHPLIYIWRLVQLFAERFLSPSIQHQISHAQGLSRYSYFYLQTRCNF